MMDSFSFGKSFLFSAQRQTHTYVIGQPGTGKSRLLESWVMQDVIAGNGICVIDPHGDLFQNLLRRLVLYPKVWGKLVVIDPCDKEWAVNINPLASFPGVSTERIAAFLTDILLKIWRINSTDAPRMTWLMINSFIALSDLGLTLSDLPNFLLDQNFRERYLPKLKNQNALFYFKHEYPRSDSNSTQWASPLLNKLGGILFDPDIYPLFSNGNTLNFRNLLNDRNIILVNIPKGILGENTSALIGAFIVAQIQKAALSRSDQSNRPPFYLYLDEFQNYTTDNIQDILSESRKYALSLILANQYLDQLPMGIRSAILNTAGTLISFRVGFEDAKTLAHMIFPIQNKVISNNRILFSESRFLPVINAISQFVDNQGSASTLVNLPDREFWANSRKQKEPIHCRTFNMNNDWIGKPEIEPKVKTLVNTSGKNYGYLKLKPYRNQKTVDPDSVSAQNDLPLWGE